MSPSIEAGLWVVISLLAQPMAQILWPRIKPKAGEWADMVEKAGSWLYALGPLYLSLLTGAVLGSRLGLYGFGLERSLLGALTGVLLFIGLYGLRRYLSGRVILPTSPAMQHALKDELRWAFYRGAAASWLGVIWLGGLVGLGLAALEWALVKQTWTGAGWRDPDQWMSLARAGTSAGLFSLSGNLWLVLVVQMLGVLIWRMEPPVTESEMDANI